MRHIAWLLLLIPLAARADEQGLLCRGAIQAAERSHNIPAHLLMAIGRVESGRREPESGGFHPWPWTINAEGRGQFFATRAAAIAEVQALQARGVRSIDIGCLQVNLRHHPEAFSSLEQAFDPASNASYAARFLGELQTARGGDWQQAAGAYHSQTPERAEPYRSRVLAAWAEEQGQPHPPIGSTTPPPSAAALAAARAAPGGGGGFLSNGADRTAVLPATPGTQGRGLDAYRNVPVPIASRTPPRLLASNR